MRGRIFPLLLMLTIIPLGLLSSTSPILAARHKPFGAYHVEPLSKILYPTIGAPVIIKTGSTFPVFLKSDLREGRDLKQSKLD
jgi:hypothetical protein